LKAGDDLEPRSKGNKLAANGKQSRAELLEEQIHSAVLQERERLAREIHDNMGPALNFIQAQALVVQEYIAQNDLQQATNHLQRISRVTGETCCRLREYLSGLKPARGGDFLIQLQDHLQQFCELHDFAMHPVAMHPVTVFRGPYALFTPESGAQVLRIIQEAFNNIQKHAAAREINLEIRNDQGLIRITVRDDGKGFSMQAAGFGNHYGLSIMNERAAMIGGILVIESAPGQGTQVLLQLPCSKGFKNFKYFFTVTLQKRC
jgi:signal transduction histidine kinase